MMDYTQNCKKNPETEIELDFRRDLGGGELEYEALSPPIILLIFIFNHILQQVYH